MDVAARRWQAGINTEQDFARFNQRSFLQRLWQSQFAYALNPNFVLTSFIQYDTESRSIGTNTRARWTVKPGTGHDAQLVCYWRLQAKSPNDAISSAASGVPSRPEEV